MSRSDKRKASLGRIVLVSMVCQHTVPFSNKIKPKPGEIIWCGKCADYKEVVRDPG